MKKRIQPYKIIIAVVLILIIVLTMRVKVVPLDQLDVVTGNVKFDAAADVADFWDSLALPELTGKAFELSDFLNDAGADLNSQQEKYGFESLGSIGIITYTAKGTGKVVASEIKKTSSTITVAVDGYDGDVEVVIQLGKIFKGTTVRDSLSFIDFNNYTNQVDWANVSKSILNVISETVIAPIDIENLDGKTIEFTGCFIVESNDKIVLTPVALNVVS